ncbi:MAG: hypothetical protein ACKVQA_06900 [Burkholderiales bacterium]
MDRLDPDSDYQYDATNRPLSVWAEDERDEREEDEPEDIENWDTEDDDQHDAEDER